MLCIGVINILNMTIFPKVSNRVNAIHIKIVMIFITEIAITILK
jgi:hypothetical protein